MVLESWVPFILPGTHVMNTKAISLTRHLLDQEAKHPALGAEFCHLMVQLAFAAKIMAREISRAALIDRLGLVGGKNTSGDAQKKLDIFTNETMIEAFARTGLVAEIISEEMEEPKRVPGGNDAQFVLCTDPLDGSSNTDSNGRCRDDFRRIPSARNFTERRLASGSPARF